MAVNAFFDFGKKAPGESIQVTNKDWIEIKGFNWDIETPDSSFTGGGSSMGKPKPGKFSFESAFNCGSPMVLGFICAGSNFPECKMQLLKTTGKSTPEPYFEVTMNGVFVTKIELSADEEGAVVQKVELVFKSIKIDYKRQNNENGSLGPKIPFSLNVMTSEASPAPSV